MIHDSRYLCKKKIGFVHLNYPAGGVEIVTSILAAYLKQHYQIIVFAEHIHSAQLTKKDKTNIIFVQASHDDLFGNAHKNNDFITQINELQIDVIVLPIHINFIFQTIKTYTNAKIVFAHHSLPFYEIEYKKQNSLKKSLSYNPLRRWYYLNYHLPKKLVKYQQLLEQKYIDIFKICDSFIVLCDSYKEFFNKNLNSPSLDKLAVISNALPALSEQVNPNKKKQLLYVGRMTYADKRIDRLISIWNNIYQRFPDWEFILVGDGEERENLERQASAYGVERIIFCGTTRETYKYYHDASILCLSSQFEGVPLVLLEAQQSGVIPIAFNCSAGVEAVLSPSWENGVLIDNFSMSDYENALCKLMTNEELRKKIYNNVLNKAQDYDIKNIGAAWHALFTKLLSK